MSPLTLDTPVQVELRKLKAAELRRALEVMGLTTEGNRYEMLERLQVRVRGQGRGEVRGQGSGEGFRIQKGVGGSHDTLECLPLGETPSHLSHLNLTSWPDDDDASESHAGQKPHALNHSS